MFDALITKLVEEDIDMLLLRGDVVWSFGCVHAHAYCVVLLGAFHMDLKNDCVCVKCANASNGQEKAIRGAVRDSCYLSQVVCVRLTYVSLSP